MVKNILYRKVKIPQDFNPTQVKEGTVCNSNTKYHIQYTVYKKGFTLIELLLYIGISSTLLVSLVIFLGTITRAHIKNATVNEVEYQGARIMRIISHVAATAQAVNSPAESASAATLSLNISTTEDNPTVFDISGSKLRITQGASAPVELTSSRVVVSDLTFNNLTRPGSADVVRVSFTLAHANPSGGNEYDYSKTFYGSANLQK